MIFKKKGAGEYLLLEYAILIYGQLIGRVGTNVGQISQPKNGNTVLAGKEAPFKNSAMSVLYLLTIVT